MLSSPLRTRAGSDNATNAECPAEGSSDASTPAADAPRDALAYVTPGYEAAVSAGPNPNNGYGVLFNAMIAPFAVGPMALNTFIWFQGGAWPSGWQAIKCRVAPMPA